MTRDEWLEEYRHQFGGMLLDLLADLHGSALSVKIRLLQRKTDALLAEAWAKAFAEGQKQTRPAAVNGTPAAPPLKVANR